jgi:hypothetical protein
VAVVAQTMVQAKQMETTVVLVVEHITTEQRVLALVVKVMLVEHQQ